MPFTNKNKFYQEIDANLVITHQGLCVVQDDYVERQKLSSPVFIFKNLNDLFLFKKLIPEDFGDFGAIFCEDKGVHKTPVLFQANNIFVLDSIGTGTPTCGSLTKLEEIFESRFSRSTLYVSESQRQADQISCGSEAFLILKEALRLNMAEHYKTDGRVRTVPPSLAKYAQARAFILNNLQEFQGNRKYEISRKTNDFTLKECGVLDGILIADNKQGGQQSLLTYLDAHPDYSALATRRDKHIRTIDAALASKTGLQLHLIIAKASGLGVLLPGITPDMSRQELIACLMASDLFFKLQSHYGCIDSSIFDKTDHELEQDLARRRVDFTNVYHDFISHRDATLEDVISRFYQVLALIQVIEKPELSVITEMAKIPGDTGGSLGATMSPVPKAKTLMESPKGVADLHKEPSRSPGCSMLFGDDDDY